MKNNVSKIQELCSGCNLCGDVCPKNAITYEQDCNGFIYPRINLNSCCNCGLCLNKCPVLTNVKNETAKKCFAITTEFSHECSSGGAFKQFALYFLNKKYLVYGAGFTNGLKLKHYFIDNKEKLDGLLKSKYLQSDCFGIYKQIVSQIKNGNLILFVGTPCQVSALKNLLSDKQRESVILIDIICHGVMSQKMFDEAIQFEQKKIKTNIKSFSFRSDWKSQFGHTYEYKYEKNNKTKVNYGFSFQFPFYQAYLKRRLYRSSCYKCFYTTKERVGDITLGDCWEITKIDDSFKEGQTSCVIANNQKGLSIIYDVFSNNLKEIPLDFIVEHNYSFAHPLNIDIKQREEELNVYANEGFASLYKKFYSMHGYRLQNLKARMPNKLYLFLKGIYNKIRGSK